MKVVLWIGNESNQRALANKIHDILPLSGIVTETRKGKSTLSLNDLLKKGIEKIISLPIDNAWRNMKYYYDELYPNFPEVKRIDVENINSKQAYEFSKELIPDLVLVSGTRLVKDLMLSLNPTIGILNLHTGLSPYVKGGPNCTNWCIATEQFHLIGNTIMWIDAGIDSGNILSTEVTNFSSIENLKGIHIQVMEHAHDLYIRAIKSILKGKINNIPQASISTGKTYYTRDWTIKKKIKLMFNLNKMKRSFQNGETELKRKEIKVISIN